MTEIFVLNIIFCLSSWHEIGLYDSPAEIDFILNKTNQKKLFHVCVSEGCTELYVMTSLKPEYNDKIIFSANLAPAAFFQFPTYNAMIVFHTPYTLKVKGCNKHLIERI